MARAALCVGIDAYDDHPLTGCVDDAVAMAELLAWNEGEMTDERPGLFVKGPGAK